MGVTLVVGRSKFTVAPDCEEKALRALQRRHEKELLYGGDDLPAAGSLDEAMSMFGWELRRHGGRIRGLRRHDDKSTVATQTSVFEALARFVDAGSYVELADSYDGKPLRLTFDGKRCRPVAIRMDDLREELDVLEERDEAEAAKAAVMVPPTFDAVKASLPAERTAYAPAMSVRVGEWIEHPTLGPGKVVGVSGERKVQVVFEAGLKVLAVGAARRAQ
jgi:hypothetical protein